MYPMSVSAVDLLTGAHSQAWGWCRKGNRCRQPTRHRRLLTVSGHGSPVLYNIMTSLPILHFNDVYRVTPQKLDPSKPNETIDVTQFAALLNDLRDRWPERPDGRRDGLVLFSGDVFSPSMESSVTRGSHMVLIFYVILASFCSPDIDSRLIIPPRVAPSLHQVPVMNNLGIDVTVTGWYLSWVPILALPPAHYLLQAIMISILVSTDYYGRKFPQKLHALHSRVPSPIQVDRWYQFRELNLW